MGATAAGPFVKPSLEPMLQPGYPLSEPVVLFLHPKAPPVVSEFADFCASLSGAKIAAKHGLITPLHEQQYQSELRLKKFRAGKGVRVSCLGIGDCRAGISDLAIAFVKAKEVVQLSYASVSSDVASIGTFASGDGKMEVLILGDRPSRRAMELHSEKWNALGRGGTGPVEYVIASRAVGVIVNPANKIKSLTVEQIQAIYSGEIKNWALFGETGLTVPAGPGGKPGEIRIHPLGLYQRDPATSVFAAECLARDKWRGVKSKKDSDAALVAVSVDPSA
ncbi:MAG: hypothetical protein GY794_08635, partial [bacterium]|nr:hypothetical protein [bacterium]